MNWPAIFTADAGGLIGSALTFLSALGAAYFLYRSTLKVARRNLLVQTITTERAKWRAELRSAVENLHVTAATALAKPTVEHLAQFDRQRVAIRLRLNTYRTANNPQDIAISDALVQLRLALQQRNEVAVLTQLNVIERAAQLLIKGEWQKSKGEAKSGELSE